VFFCWQCVGCWTRSHSSSPRPSPPPPYPLIITGVEKTCLDANTSKLFDRYTRNRQNRQNHKPVDQQYAHTLRAQKRNPALTSPSRLTAAQQAAPAPPGRCPPTPRSRGSLGRGCGASPPPRTRAPTWRRCTRPPSAWPPRGPPAPPTPWGLSLVRCGVVLGGGWVWGWV